MPRADAEAALPPFLRGSRGPEAAAVVTIDLAFDCGVIASQ